jgi:hypothetical protein
MLKYELYLFFPVVRVYSRIYFKVLTTMYPTRKF